MVSKLPLANCESCPAKDGKLVPPELPRGKARLAIVGEAPGRTELEEGRPFVGPSGRLLDRGLRANGINRKDCLVTNAVPCGCREKDFPAARKACEARLQAELATVEAPVVMPLGSLALQSVLQSGKRPQILKWRGSVNPRSFSGDRERVSREAHTLETARSDSGPRYLVCPTLHPAFVLRSPAWGPTLEIDFARVARYVDGQSFTPPEEAEGRETVIATDRSLLTSSLERLSRSPEISFDVETVGLGPVTTLLVCFALSDGELTVVVPWSRGRDGAIPWWDDSAAVAKEVSEVTAATTIITHNGPAFDHIVARRYGLGIRRWDDTLLAAWAGASHMPKGLSALVQTQLDVTAWKESESKNAGTEGLWGYNALDSCYTQLLWRKVKPGVS